MARRPIQINSLEDYKRLLSKLPPEQFEMDAVFRRIRDKEVRRHPSVKVVHELTGTEPACERELFTSLGYPDAKLRSWTASDSLEYVIREIPKGGHVKIVDLPDHADPCTFVFVKCLDEDDVAMKNSILITVLMHEMGHVDDIEKKKHIRFDGEVDMVAAEEYAHRYAIRRMIKENLRYPLGALLASILRSSRHDGDHTVSQAAARRIVESGQYRESVRFVGDLLDIESLAAIDE